MLLIHLAYLAMSCFIIYQYDVKTISEENRANYVTPTTTFTTQSFLYVILKLSNSKNHRLTIYLVSPLLWELQL